MNTVMPSREQIETALDTGKLWVAMQNGNYWQARRNGKTQVWKTRPTNFSIPIKYGFKGTSRISHTERSNFGAAWPSHFIISDEKPGPRTRLPEAVAHAYDIPQD